MTIDCRTFGRTDDGEDLAGHLVGTSEEADPLFGEIGLETLGVRDAGTIFLDEVGELPASLRGSLLRNIEQRNRRPVGGTGTPMSNLRLICSTSEEPPGPGSETTDDFWERITTRFRLPPSASTETTSRRSPNTSFAGCDPTEKRSSSTLRSAHSWRAGTIRRTCTTSSRSSGASVHATPDRASSRSDRSRRMSASNWGRSTTAGSGMTSSARSASPSTTAHPSRPSVRPREMRPFGSRSRTREETSRAPPSGSARRPERSQHGRAPIKRRRTPPGAPAIPPRSSRFPKRRCSSPAILQRNPFQSRNPPGGAPGGSRNPHLIRCQAGLNGPRSNVAAAQGRSLCAGYHLRYDSPSVGVSGESTQARSRPSRVAVVAEIGIRRGTRSSGAGTPQGHRPSPLATGLTWRTSPPASERRHGLHELPSVWSPHQAKGPHGTREGGGAMSTQGGTLQRRGTIELPMWPVAVLVVVAIAAAIGMTALGDAGQTRFVTSVSDSERFANSTAAVREQGAALPVRVGISHVAPSLHSLRECDDRDGMGFVGRPERSAAPPVQPSPGRRGTGARLGSDDDQREALHAVQVDLRHRGERGAGDFAGPFPSGVEKRTPRLLHGSGCPDTPHKRLRPAVQVADPVPRLERWRPLAGLIFSAFRITSPGVNILH